ncbi:POZ domain-containing protein [Atractiella rhizophila]|nr:POZ domain-containing protein [Atractiella rhizophila]
MSSPEAGPSSVTEKPIDVSLAPEDASKKYVKLVSRDGFEFVVLREAACQSEMIRSSLDNDYDFEEARTGVMKMNEYANVVEVLVQYMYYKLYYTKHTDEDLPNFESRIPLEIALEVMEAADFLDL